MKPLAAVVAVTLTALVAPATAQGKVQDVIQTKRGKRIRGVEVTEMTTQTIKYTRGETELELPANLLLKIRWSNAPEAFALGQSAVNRGDFASAADHFATAAQETNRDALKSEAQYLAAEALVQSAGTDALKAGTAADTLTAFLSESPDNFRVPDALLQLGRAQLLKGDPDGAATTLKRLADDSLAKNWNAIWGARAKFERARALLVKEDWGNARATFRAAGQAADAAAGGNTVPELENLKANAKVGEGETFVREGKYDEALRFFDQLARGSTGVATRAAAKCGQGEALFLKAEATKTQDGLRAAQIALAEANLIDPSGADTSAKSLYYSGKVLLALGADREASNFKTRAMGYFTTVTTQYAQTEWAGKARTELQR